MSFSNFVENNRNNILIGFAAFVPWFWYGIGRQTFFGLNLTKQVLWLITGFCAVILLVLNYEERKKVGAPKPIWEIERLVRDQFSDSTGAGMPFGFVLGEMITFARERGIPVPGWRLLFYQDDSVQRACYIETDSRGWVSAFESDVDPTEYRKYFVPETLKSIKQLYYSNRLIQKSQDLQSKIDAIESVLPEKEFRRYEKLKERDEEQE